MPSNWQAIDNDFPSFTGEESPAQQIKALHNYLFKLREGLKYSLQNLTTDNFNETALQNMTEEQKKAFAQQLISIETALGQVSARVSRISAQIGGVTNEWIEGLERRVKELEEDTTAADTEQSVSGAGGLKERMSSAEGEIDGLTEVAADHEDRIQALEDDDTLNQISELLTGENGLQSQVAALQERFRQIAGILNTGEDGTTLGKEGTALRLVGDVYINGVLFEQGGST